MTRWDVVVVGAGFAGLACAESAPPRGLPTHIIL
jgi:phytoene dehydrogenase-like protein